MSGRSLYEVLVTNPAGETEASRHESKDDARLEVERMRRFHPNLAARMELLEEEAPPAEPPASSPRDFECPNCKAPVVSLSDFHVNRKQLFSTKALRRKRTPPTGWYAARGPCTSCSATRAAAAPSPQSTKRDPGRDCPECGSVMLWEARECPTRPPSFPGNGRYDADGPVRERPPSFEPGAAQGSLF